MFSCVVFLRACAFSTYLFDVVQLSVKFRYEESYSAVDGSCHVISLVAVLQFPLLYVLVTLHSAGIVIVTFHSVAVASPMLVTFRL